MAGAGGSGVDSVPLPLPAPVAPLLWRRMLGALPRRWAWMPTATAAGDVDAASDAADADAASDGSSSMSDTCTGAAVRVVVASGAWPGVECGRPPAAAAAGLSGVAGSAAVHCGTPADGKLRGSASGGTVGAVRLPPTATASSGGLARPWAAVVALGLAPSPPLPPPPKVSNVTRAGVTMDAALLRPSAPAPAAAVNGSGAGRLAVRLPPVALGGGGAMRTPAAAMDAANDCATLRAGDEVAAPHSGGADDRGTTCTCSGSCPLLRRRDGAMTSPPSPPPPPPPSPPPSPPPPPPPPRCRRRPARASS